MSRKELLGTLCGTGRGHILGADHTAGVFHTSLMAGSTWKVRKVPLINIPFVLRTFNRDSGHNTCLMDLCTPTGLTVRPRKVECNYKYTLLPRWEVMPGMATLSLHRSWIPHPRPEWCVWNTQKNEKKIMRKKTQLGAGELALKSIMPAHLCMLRQTLECIHIINT